MSKARELAELSRTVSDSADAVAITIDSSENVSFANGIDVTGTTTTANIITDEDQSGLLTLGRFSSGFAYSLIRPSTNATGLEIRTFAGNALARFLNTGVTELYHDGAAKLATASTGIDVTGSISATGDLTLSSAGPGITLTDTDNNPDYQIKNGNGSFRIIDTTASQDRININSSAHVGINNNSPEYALDVDDDTGNAYIAINRATQSQGEVGFKLDGGTSGGDWFIYQKTSGDDLNFYRGSDLVTIKTDGKFGVGTTTPDTLVELVGADPILTIRDSSTSSASGIATLRLAETGASDSLDQYFDIRANAGKLEIVDNWNEGGGTGTRVTLDDAGRVGIGTGSPQTSTKGLHVVHDATEGTPSFPLGEVIIAQRNFNSAQGCHIGIIGGSAGDAGINFGDKDDADIGRITYNNGDDSMRFLTNTSEAGRFSSNGELLIGVTSTTVPGVGNTTAGVSIRGDDGSFFSRSLGSGDTNNVVSINRTNADGNILGFQKDGTTVGTIGTTGTHLTIGTDDTGLIFNKDVDAIYPWDVATNSGRDNAVNLGIANRRIKNIYVSSGIYLGGTGAANHLTDYEEGTHNTSITFGSGSVTTSNNTLSYTKIGRQVIVTGYVSLSSISSPNGIMFISLPFPVASGVQYRASANIKFNQLAANTNITEAAWGIAQQNNSNLAVYGGSSHNVDTGTGGRLAANTDFRISVTYVTSA